MCSEVVDAVDDALGGVTDWGPNRSRPGQYGFDLVADAAALEVLDRTEFGVSSEESGLRRSEAPLIAVIDPVDVRMRRGASLGMPAASAFSMSKVLLSRSWATSCQKSVIPL